MTWSVTMRSWSLRFWTHWPSCTENIRFCTCDLRATAKSVKCLPQRSSIRFQDSSVRYYVPTHISWRNGQNALGHNALRILCHRVGQNALMADKMSMLLVSIHAINILGSNTYYSTFLLRVLAGPYAEMWFGGRTRMEAPKAPTGVGYPLPRKILACSPLKWCIFMYSRARFRPTIIATMIFMISAEIIKKSWKSQFAQWGSFQHYDTMTTTDVSC